ncbi:MULTISPECIES: M24 family metallopeptidase [unclassified Rhizobium]|uniref:M24 family metallopeptidase n=1 Tax=unclassified Rhizobium TaxID=2613769 RepID=UPI001ADBDF63|nr:MULTISPECIES: Xaa-Pro peptidase family protein [unclassified Rhizobium]MBO9125017.1 aminopeptidase P family protein [Rhizobium sp. 16-488-2b]MBO9175602.1 aminopeptidase P family protein [Rhizobium sp. 16-488-2a]
MGLHFETSEFADRLARLTQQMQEEKLDALLLFAQESMYWLTGYDTFGYCFFQTLIVKADGTMALLTRSADLRQARQTSIIENIHIWVDRVNADPTVDLKNLLVEMDLLGARIGVEYDTHGMTGRIARLLDTQLMAFGQISDASYLVSRLRLIKSPTEIAYVERAAALADDALDAALSLTKAGADEAAILAAMQGAVFAGGGDYPANEFIIGSGADALLCRYKAGRRRLDANDQLTLEWAGAYAHYHAAMMRTIVIGEPSYRHRELYNACLENIQAIETVLKPGHTFGDVFDVHSKIMEERGLSRHRLNACGYSLGARFSPSWMEHQMFHVGNPQPIEPGMSLFVHMIIMDSDSGTAMTLGQTYLTTAAEPKALSRHPLDFINL